MTNRADAYAVLAAELEKYRAHAGDRLAALVGTTSRKVLTVGKDECLVEVKAEWTSPKMSSVKLTAVVYGPSHLMTERYEEALTLPVHPEPAGRCTNAQ